MELSTNYTQKPGTVFLTGGTGTVCRRIAALLQAASISCAAASRSGQAPPIPNPNIVAGVRFDWADHSTWEPALKLAGDVRAIYLVMPGSKRFSQLLSPLSRKRILGAHFFIGGGFFAPRTSFETPEPSLDYPEMYIEGQSANFRRCSAGAGSNSGGVRGPRPDQVRSQALRAPELDRYRGGRSGYGKSAYFIEGARG